MKITHIYFLLYVPLEMEVFWEEFGAFVPCFMNFVDARHSHMRRVGARAGGTRWSGHVEGVDGFESVVRYSAIQTLDAKRQAGELLVGMLGRFNESFVDLNGECLINLFDNRRKRTGGSVDKSFDVGMEAFNS